MAIKNSLAKTTSQTSNAITFKANGEDVKLSPKMIKDYLVAGNGQVTDQEVVMFLSLCKFQHLNPFTRDAYLIKYGNSPATVVVGKDVLLKRAMRSEKFGGLTAGVIVVNANGEIEEREGTFVLPDENLVGGWAKVIIKNYDVPFYASVSMKEYSTGMSNWLTKPATMIRKVALAQALREAFPEETTALYEASEMDKTVVDTTGKEIVVDETPIAMPAEDGVETPVQSVEADKVITPSKNTASSNKGNSDGQGSIEEIMFGNQAAGLVGEPPFEVN